MTVKQKVNYSVQYDSSTDTLSTQLTTLLNRIALLIRTNDPELIEVSRVVYGSEQMNGAPMYDSGTTKEFESDVIFLGTDSDNIALSLCFYKGRLVIAMNMCPSVEALHVENWDNLTKGQTTPMATTFLPYCTSRAAKWYTGTSNSRYNVYNTSLPYIITNNSIEFDVVYWTGDYSSGYMFYNVNRATNGVDLVIYKTSENPSGTQSLGACIWRYSNDVSVNTEAFNDVAPSEILAWSFEENLANNMPSRIYTNNYAYPGNPGYMPKREITGRTINEPSNFTYSDSASLLNSRYETRQWFSVGTNAGWGMAWLHTLGSLKGIVDRNDTIPTITSVSTVETTDNNVQNSFISPLLTAYNIPYLSEGECYLRRMRIPGFNKYCKGEIYLFYSPTNVSYNTGDIVTVDGKQFAVINKGIVCFVARVS